VSGKEQAVAIPVGRESLVLEGIWQGGADRVAVVAPPHPEYGGSLDNPVVTELAHALQREGWASLRFNWRGVGGSQGRATGESGPALADYLAAVEHAAQTLPGPLLAAGYSFGAATALRAALHDERIGRLLLVAPPPAMLRAVALGELTQPLRVIVGAEDGFAPLHQLQPLFDQAADVRLEVIAEADHFFFTSGLAELGRLARELLAT
jgi:alpha/beta superfamily hydrolase